jgi:Molybdopterin-binding domain of aldehyde dehydrogenase
VVLSEVLDYPQHKIHVNTKRLGGGFGGKESRSALLAALAAVPAYHLKRPVRIALDRDEDMQFTGQRHAFMAKYKVRSPVRPGMLSIVFFLQAIGAPPLPLSVTLLQLVGSNLLTADWNDPFGSWHWDYCLEGPLDPFGSGFRYCCCGLAANR